MKTNKNILYVDDEKINLEIFKINLHRFFQIETAQSGTEGLEILDKHQNINLVISDMRMPEMDGLEFIKQAKEKHPNIQFYIMTGYDVTPDIKDALDSKLIEKHFSKPYDVSNLLTSIN